MAKKSKNAYIEANIAYLKEVASEADTQKLPKGVLYKVIDQGEGTLSPQLGSVISVHYRGTMIDGREFDSTLNSPCPATFRLREVIEGWQIAMQQMHVGDKWRIYIPASLGYGNRTIDNIRGGSTLIFEVELLSIS